MNTNYQYVYLWETNPEMRKYSRFISKKYNGSASQLLEPVSIGSIIGSTISTGIIICTAFSTNFYGPRSRIFKYIWSGACICHSLFLVRDICFRKYIYPVGIKSVSETSPDPSID